jgi:hypothetical protein
VGVATVYGQILGMSQRGFITLPIIIGVVIGGLCLALWGAWQYASLQSERADRWERGWQEQAEEARKQRIYARASEESAMRAEAIAQQARGRERRFRSEIDKIAQREKPGDPCLQLLTASLCSDVADSMRRAAASISRADVPGPASASTGADSGGAVTGSGTGRGAASTETAGRSQ